MGAASMGTSPSKLHALNRISLISDFSGNAREAKCPRCLFSFVPQPGNLLQVLYARAGLGT